MNQQGEHRFDSERNRGDFGEEGMRSGQASQEEWDRDSSGGSSGNNMQDRNRQDGSSNR
jgi:hypothetical protein